MNVFKVSVYEQCFRNIKVSESHMHYLKQKLQNSLLKFDLKVSLMLNYVMLGLNFLCI